ncbi:GGDEF domain-containing protein [uncultured Amphritea sp.]|mgnify:FL=1|uniref:GGDEF domain-containing protein n=1 Tax=Amphritea sp. TaxID=1872502 RepID=UPI0025FF3AA8|nr:GGDEF domain-containing protein [uncultured Amphritea sp.]
MARYNLQKTVKLMIPGIILMLLAPVIHSQLHDLTFIQQQLLGYLPPLLGGLAVILCISFNQGRLLLTTVNLLCLFLLIQNQLQSSLSQPANFVLFSCLSLLFPLLQLFINFIPERGLSTRWLIRHLPVIVSGYLFFWVAAQNHLLSDWFDGLPMGLIQMYSDPYLLSQWAVSLFAVTTLLGLIILWFRATLADACLVIITATIAAMLALFSESSISVLSCTLGLVLILFTVLFNSYSMAFIDELTGLPGRRALENTLRSAGRHYTLGMVDIDHFKKFNDTYGHDVGDQVLKMVASQMKQAARGATVFRYGGEEFTIVFKKMDEVRAIEIAEKVRTTIAAYPMRIRDKNRPGNEKQGRQLRNGSGRSDDTTEVTISIGLCEKTREHKDSQAVIKQADEALYLAKQQGRNRSVACHITQPPTRRAARS